VQPGIGENDGLQLTGTNLFRDSCCFVDVAAANPQISIYHRRIVKHEEFLASGCSILFDDLDFQNWYPNPSAETGDTGKLLYEFDPPDSDVFEVSLDARSAPGAFGEIEDGRVRLLEDDDELVAVSFHTWSMP
jgi:hypothetical protein